MATRFLDDAARAAFKRAIETVENGSAVEVVVAVRRRSAGYRHANVAVGVVVAFVGLAAMLYSSHSFQISSILIDPFVVGVLAGGLVELLPAVKRWLTPRSWRSAQVLRAARATFLERGVHTTTDRSGLLVYISWLEHEVALVADSGLVRELPDQLLVDVAAEMSSTVGQGGVAVARRVEALAAALGAAMPHRDDDVNELPDAIDSDLERR